MYYAAMINENALFTYFSQLHLIALVLLFFGPVCIKVCMVLPHLGSI